MFAVKCGKRYHRCSMVLHMSSSLILIISSISFIAIGQSNCVIVFSGPVKLKDTVKLRQEESSIRFMEHII